MAGGTRIRMNYSETAEAMVNKQINMEFYASYVYLAMASFFGRDDVALHGFAKMFRKSSDEERGHGLKLATYQAMRGGRVVFQDIAKPSSMEWSSPLEALEAVLELEKAVNSSLLAIHQEAEDKHDAHLEDFLEAEFLEDQVESIKKIGDLITRLSRVGSGLGEHIIDKELFKTE